MCKITRLKDCGKKPNCVCSFQDPSDRGHHIEAMPVAKNPVEFIWQHFSSQKRVEMITRDSNYLHVVCYSKIFRFPDDVEFLYLEESSQLHFRSASRIGRSDFGVNRKRVEGIKKLLSEKFCSESSRK